MVTLHKLRKILMILIGIGIVWTIFSLLNSTYSIHPSQSSYSLSKDLDKPILITSAGQSTDTYIVQNLANELRLNNLFMPEANSLKNNELSSIIIAVGYSKTGLKLHSKSFENEYSRVEDLIEEAHSLNLPIITIFIGNIERRNSKTDKLLTLACSSSDYIITTLSSDHGNFISNLSKTNDIPISFIKNINDLTKPLASVFR